MMQISGPRFQHTTMPRMTLHRARRTPVVSEAMFRTAVARERRRADRVDESVESLLVTLSAPDGDPSVWRAIFGAIGGILEDGDIVGWIEKERTVGVLLAGMLPAPTTFAADLQARLRRDIAARLDTDGDLDVSIETWGEAESRSWRDATEMLCAAGRPSWYQHVKRAFDLVASALLLLFLSPVFAIAAALVKLTSPGPVLFRQQRVGQNMVPFEMLKFRTMQVNADQALHKQFVSSFIKSQDVSAQAGAAGVFKLTKDPRITSVGRILRKTSIDELPQLWNVLRGEMSLVGPRPPLAYEVEQYRSWHLRRVLDAKPGLTGLWQVSGRSRMTFDEMVRLDLRYARHCSLALDLRILLATPRAVVSGKGAC